MVFRFVLEYPIETTQTSSKVTDSGLHLDISVVSSIRMTEQKTNISSVQSNMLVALTSLVIFQLFAICTSDASKAPISFSVNELNNTLTITSSITSSAQSHALSQCRWEMLSSNESWIPIGDIPSTPLKGDVIAIPQIAGHLRMRYFVEF